MRLNIIIGYEESKKKYHRMFEFSIFDILEYPSHLLNFQKAKGGSYRGYIERIVDFLRDDIDLCMDARICHNGECGDYQL
jgi:hypothetical protein